MSFLAEIPVWVWVVVPLGVTIVLIRTQNHRLRSPRKSKRAVEGIAHVVSVSEYGRRSGISQGYCTMTLVLEAPGMQATTVTFKQMIAPKVWPTAGTTLPIFVDPDHPKRYSIRWGEQPSPAAEAAAQAAQLESRLRAHGTYDPSASAHTAPTTSHAPDGGRTVNVSDMDAASRARVQSMLDDARALLNGAEGLGTDSHGTARKPSAD